VKRKLAGFGLAIGALVGAVVIGAWAAGWLTSTTNPGNKFSTGSILMTNVAGTAVHGTNCATPGTVQVCATLFDTAPMAPGTLVSNSVTVTTSGTLTPSTFTLSAANFIAKDVSSAAICTAADPAASLDLVIKQGVATIFTGTLSSFAAAHATPATGIDVTGGGAFTIDVTLDAATPTTGEGCVSLADLVWTANS
jgi:hypothetical protein